tara:strand:- start:8734 stop:9657 length:924 start_codon:yes stop_codon:yes gene_type:complete
MSRLTETQKKFVKVVHKLPFDQFSKSQYALDYFKSYLQKTHYEAYILDALVNEIECPNTFDVVDFGGGIGMLSLMLHIKGYSNIVMVDHNSEACNFAKNMFKHLHIDVLVLCGSQKEIPSNSSILIARDVVEHIYDFPNFLYREIEQGKLKEFVFGTSANPHNLLRKRYFKNIHKKAEEEYYGMRKSYFEKKGMSDETALTKAKITKGLRFCDFENDLKINTTYSSNTCHPETGNWAERLEKISWYAQIIDDYKTWKFSVGLLNWNNRENALWKKIVFSIINWINAVLKSQTLAPYLIFTYRKNEKY